MDRRGIALQRDHRKRRLAAWPERPELAHARRHLGQGERPQADCARANAGKGRLQLLGGEHAPAPRRPGRAVVCARDTRTGPPAPASRSPARARHRPPGRAAGRGAGRTRSTEASASTRRSISTGEYPTRPVAQLRGQAQLLAGRAIEADDRDVGRRLERPARPEQPAQPEALLQGHARRATA